jgi:hypothetical protein
VIQRAQSDDRNRTAAPMSQPEPSVFKMLREARACLSAIDMPPLMLRNEISTCAQSLVAETSLYHRREHHSCRDGGQLKSTGSEQIETSPSLWG